MYLSIYLSIYLVKRVVLRVVVCGVLLVVCVWVACSSAQTVYIQRGHEHTRTGN